MDSRIREIEQWLDEAKNDLQDGGREAYLRKLYLLDAEIRAVIKENDPLPEMQASAGRRAPRAISLPVAVAGIAAFVVIGSAIVLGQGAITGNLRSAGFTGDVASSNLDSELTMASLNRFPQGEELITLDELDPAQQAPMFTGFDKDRVLAALSSEDFSPDSAVTPLENASLLVSNAGQPAAGQPHKGPVGDIGDEPRPVYSPSKGNNGSNSGIEVHMAMARQTQDATAIQVPASPAIPMGQPTLSSLSQNPDNRAQSEPLVDQGRFNFPDWYSDSSGVDPLGSSSNANGRSSEVKLTGGTSGTKAKDGQVEKKKMGLDPEALKKIANTELNADKESKKKKDS